MQGEGKKGAGYQPLPNLEDTEEPTQPALPQSSGAMSAYNPENEIDMHEGAGGVKRGQTEPEENSHNEKWRKHEGIKRRLQDEPTQPALHQFSGTMPVYHLENKIYMHEGVGGVKRGQTEFDKNSQHDKWRKHEGIKRGLREIPCVPYEEYEASWDQETQAKKCKGSINCMLDCCG